MIIAQITDLHIGLDVGGAHHSNLERLAITLDTINQLRRQPDLLLVTGDLTDSGNEDQYLDLKNALSDLKVATYLALGNHDNRNQFASAFPDAQFNDGFLQYAIEEYPVRILVLDTLEEGRHGGAFCEQRAHWLDAELSAQPSRPTLLALHHPPISSGIRWLSADPDEPWVKRLAAVVEKHDNIVHMISGHVHRSIFKAFGGTTISVLDAVARQVALDLDDVDVNHPDGRSLIVDSKPAFALHEWDGVSMTTHVQHAPYGDVIARYDARHADIVKMTRDH